MDYNQSFGIPPSTYYYPPQGIYQQENYYYQPPINMYPIDNLQQQPKQQNIFLMTIIYLIISYCILYLILRYLIGNDNLFKIGESKSTTWNNTSDNNHLIFLDRHNIACGNKSAINKFKYILGNSDNLEEANKFKYQYSCTSGGNLKDTKSLKSTNPSIDAEFSYLDKHDIRCETDEVLSEFQLQRPSDSTINYNYKCIKSNKPLTCRNLKTQPIIKNEIDGTRNLKNIEPSCNYDEAIQGFKIVYDNSNNTFYYDYTCCKY